MNKRTFSIKSKLLPSRLQFISDIITVLLAFFIHFVLRFYSGWFHTNIEVDFDRTMFSALSMLVYWIVIFWLAGLYKDWYVRSPFDEIFTIFQVILFGSLLLFFFVWMDTSSSPRMLILIYFLLMVTLVSSGRILSRKLQTSLRRKGIIVIQSIIVGTLNKIIDLYEKIRKSPSWGFQVIGFILTKDAADQNRFGEFEKEVPFLGFIGNLGSVIDKVRFTEVLIAMDQPEHELLMDLVSSCAENKVAVKIMPDLYDIFSGLVRTLHMYGIPLIEISPMLLKPWQSTVKRMIDISFSLLFLIVGSPLWLIFAIIIKITSKGPIFYIQERAGKNGKPFRMYKFRTMSTNADKTGPAWTAVNDSRVTNFGRFLRKSHLDEMPQFFNAFKGDMSLVGPRPEQTSLVAKFCQVVPYYRRRLVVRPGVTGWWQVKYTPYEESKEELEGRLKDDFYYIENMSIRLDLEILFRTVFLVFKGHGQT